MGLAKPLYTTSLVSVRAGHIIPETLLSKLAKEYPSAAGWAVREKGQIVVEKFTKVDDFEKFLSLLKEVNAGTKDFARLFCFHSFPAEFDEDEVQPYSLIRDSKNNPLLIAAVEGDFPGYAGDTEGRSEAFMLVDSWLGPKLEAMYGLSGNSPAKLIDYCRSSQFQADFGKELSHRGEVHFLPSVGEPFSISKNELGVTGDWGYCSNAHGYTETVTEAGTASNQEKSQEPPSVPVKPRSKYASADPTPAPSPVETKPPAPETKPPETAPVPAKTPEEKVAAKFIVEEVEWTPPPAMHGKRLKQAYRDKTGSLPSNWQERPSVKLTVKRSIDNPPVSEASPNILAASASKVVTQTTDNQMPVINGKQQAAAIEFVKKHLGDGSAVVEDPVNGNRLEEKLAKFHELMGFNRLDDINKFRTSFIFTLTKEHPETAALAIIELRSEMNRLMRVIADGSKTLGELTGTEKKDTTTAPASTPEPKVKPAEQPAQRRKSKYA